MRIGRVLRDSGKTVTAAGTLAGRPVVVKTLTSDDPFWQAKLRHEIGVYRQFAMHPPPVRVPALAGTDGSSWLAVELLAGEPLSAGRYLAGATAAGKLPQVLATVGQLNAWRPPAASFGGLADYHDRIGRYHALGYLTEADHAALTWLLGRCGPAREFCHGDLVPGNIWFTATGECALLDWEFAGWYLPGYDLALLYVLAGGAVPGLRATIADQVTAAGRQALAVNLACVATRELRMHAGLAGQAARRTVAWLQAIWPDITRMIKDAAAAL